VEIKATLKRAHTIAVHASAEVARLIRELRPTLLDTLGLAAAVHNLAETNLGSQGINVSTEFEGMDQRLPAETELALFRIAQEAISNIVRHSEARNASVRLECNDSECVLRVEDNGKGFDVSEITSIDAGGRGAGMFGMKERVTMVGGTCSCQSQPGQGARVIARVPITRSGADGEDKSTGSG
jgi:signal transduction histidine kinase